MESERFITRPLSIALDALRFLSALGVLAVHAAERYGVMKGMPFTPRLSHGSVIVFFVLSGLVIADSATRRQMELRDFAMARAARILPVALPAVLFSALAAVALALQTGPLDQGFAAAGLRSVAASLTFMSQSPLVGAPSWGNQPYWSLCYEVWYYALFGAGYFLSGWKRAAVVVLMAALAGPAVLLLFPLWLGGAWLNRSRWARSLTVPQGALYLAGAVAVIQVIRLYDLTALLWLRDRVPFALGMSEWLLSDYPLALAVMVALAALRPLADRASAWLEAWQAPIRYCAGFSFSLYLFHFPLLLLLVQFGPPLPSGGWWILAPIGAVLAAAAAIAELTERRTPALRRWLDRLTLMREPAPRILHS